MLSKPEWRWLLLGTLLLFVSLVPSLALPFIFGQLVDEIQDASLSSEERKHVVDEGLYALIVLIAAGSVATFFRSFLYNSAGERVVSRIRVKLFRAIMQQEIGMFDKRKTGELISRLTSDAMSLQSIATSNLSMLIRGVAQIAISAALMFYTAWRLALLIFLVVPFCMILIMVFMPKIKRISINYQDAVAAANNIAQESISSIRTVRSFAAEELECRKYEKAIGDPDSREDLSCCWFPRKHVAGEDISAYRAGIQRQVAGSFFQAWATLIFMTSLLAVLWFGCYEVIDGNLKYGQLASFMMYALQITMSIGMLTGFATSLSQAQGASARTFQLVDRVPKVPLDGGATEECMKGSISFENVSFTYPTRPDEPVIKNLSVNIPQDKTIAFVGSSGAGKSTVLSLIQRFYDVDEGCIKIDGQLLTSLDPSWLRQQFAIVRQEPVLFAQSIKANICYGHAAKRRKEVYEAPSDEEVEAAARAAYCHEFIKAFDKGYDTTVGERGQTLSGGQKQRVAIARALLMNPRVLLLDEATSALDAESEGFVDKAIKRAMVGRTVVIVAHRLSTVKNADQIVVMDHGRLVDKGRHEELLKGCEKYKELVRRQLGRDVSGEPEQASREESAEGSAEDKSVVRMGDGEPAPEPSATPSSFGKAPRRSNGVTDLTDPADLQAPLLDAA